MLHVSTGWARPRMRWVTIVLAALVAGCGSGGGQLPDANDSTVRARQVELAMTIEAATRRSWGAGYGRWTCSVRYLGQAAESDTHLTWATCRSNGKTAGGFSAPVTVTGATVTVADDGDRHGPWVRARFPQELADLVIARDPAVMPSVSESTAQTSPPSRSSRG